MYNADFKVKYFDIKEELLISLNNDYQDIIDICDKLYRDELTSVFYASNILDDKIDIGMKYIKDIMMANVDFKNLIYKLLELTTTELEQCAIEENALEIIFCMLFSEKIFYVLHQCICQQLNANAIQEELLIVLKDKFITMLNT